MPLGRLLGLDEYLGVAAICALIVVTVQIPQYSLPFSTIDPPLQQGTAASATFPSPLLALCRLQLVIPLLDRPDSRATCLSSLSGLWFYLHLRLACTIVPNHGEAGSPNPIEIHSSLLLPKGPIPSYFPAIPSVHRNSFTLLLLTVHRCCCLLLLSSSSKASHASTASSVKEERSYLPPAQLS
ncbi:hypothetical protein EDD37DRAFT_51470 [Exophiala viscosa]|uniref:uncharacterized protein n=1 Tax=Exophiala viscosa TaxID=2486360 RepID=UPI002199DFE6|nr:hypothetical protein EDD37DRAFT_51470 [Exophiala viscosa]